MQQPTPPAEIELREISGKKMYIPEQPTYKTDLITISALTRIADALERLDKTLGRAMDLYKKLD